MVAREHEWLPATQSKENVRRIYDRLSHFYDAWTVISESKATRRALELADIRNGENILEAGVGTGRIFERIVAANPDGDNEGFDISPGMVAVATKRLRGAAGNYTLRVADAYSIPNGDDSFDLIVCNYVFDLLPREDFATVLAEFKRVLRHGGRAVITSWTWSRKWYSRFWDWLARTSPAAMAGCRPITLVPALRSAGFAGIHEEYVSQMTFPSVVIRAWNPRRPEHPRPHAPSTA